MDRKKLEKALLQHGVIGYTLHQVCGHGVYNAIYGQSELVDHLQIDIYTSSVYAPTIAELIVDTVSVNADSEGLVAILPVDELYWIHSKTKVKAEEFAWKS
jgi:nitrogen regulatory protein P-II 1